MWGWVYFRCLKFYFLHVAQFFIYLYPQGVNVDFSSLFLSSGWNLDGPIYSYPQAGIWTSLFYFCPISILGLRPGRPFSISIPHTNPSHLHHTTFLLRSTSSIPIMYSGLDPFQIPLSTRTNLQPHLLSSQNHHVHPSQAKPSTLLTHAPTVPPPTRQPEAT